MNQTDLLKIGGIAAAVIIIGTLGLIVKQKTGDPTTNPTTTTINKTTTSTEPTPTTEPTTTPIEQDAVEETLFDPYPKGDETGETLAIAFGCGWWAKPVPGETITELAERMKPIISPKMYDDITELRNPDNDSTNTIEAIPGAITTDQPTTNPDGQQTQKYNVSCNTIEIDTENKPTGQRAQETELTITQTPNGNAYISEALLGGLTIPLT